jgi:hypothetical protein
MTPTRRSLRSAARRSSLRSLASSKLAVGALVGVVALTGLTAASASADVGNPMADGLTPAAIATNPAALVDARVEALRDITAEARDTLAAARTALADADELTAAVAASDLEVGTVRSIDTTDLAERVDRLASMDALPLLLLPEFADETAIEARRVNAQATLVRTNFDAAKAKKAAEEAAAKAKAKREAEAAAKANTPAGAKATARKLLAKHGWGDDQFSCLESLWTRESGWNYKAYNASSGATGIPQSLPGSKMASAGADWQTNATTQIRWGLDYIERAYGTPCNAWGHSQATGWY